MQEKADSDLVRRQNRQLVLQALRQEGPSARIDLGRSTGLSPATITSITAQLISENVIQELEQPFGVSTLARRGRPVVQLGIRAQAAMVLAVDISVDMLRFALADFNGVIVKRRSHATPTQTADANQYGRDVAESIRTFLNEENVALRQVVQIGIAAQGMVDDRHGVLMYSPAFDARNIALTKPISAALGIHCIIGNDANMMAEGLLANQRDKIRGTTAVVFNGFGVGMGLIVDGRVYHGATGGASEFGHMNHIPHGARCRCGRSGCIEAYAGDYGIWRMAMGQVSDGPPRQGVEVAAMKDLVARAEAGDVRAIKAFAIAGEALGFGIARLVALLNPDRIIVAERGFSAAPILEPSLLLGLEDGVIEELRREVKVEFVSYETDLILHGAIAALLRNVDGEMAEGPQVAAL